jgi:hypothetical protein
MKKSDKARTFRGRPVDPPQLWICISEQEAAEIIQGAVPLRIMEEVDELINWSIEEEIGDQSIHKITAFDIERWKAARERRQPASHSAIGRLDILEDA